MKRSPVRLARPPWGQSQSSPWAGEGMAETTGESGPGDLLPACVFQPNFMNKNQSQEFPLLESDRGHGSY